MSYIKNNIIWFAGLLEGEGCFYMNVNCPRIALNMTDKDIIDKVKELFGGSICVQNKAKYNSKWKVLYCWTANGELAISIMLSVYSLMGQRRKVKIKEVIEAWKKAPTHPKKKINSRIKEFLKEDFKNGLSYKALAAKYKLCYASVWNVVNDRTWSTITLD